MKKLNIFLMAFVAFFGLSLASCSDDDLGPSIFDTSYHPLDRSSVTFALDSFLEKNYREPYNIQFQYKYNDIGTKMNYNLVPVSYENAVKFAVLGKYLWYDVYKQEVGEQFLKQYTPHIIMLVGSPAYNASSGTETLGVAEGGLKITLYKGNEFDEHSIDSLNEYFFNTMHHEFSHILHHNVIIPTTFREISNGQYNALSWQNTNDSIALSKGCILQYATSGYQEDWVELIAHYITCTDMRWKDFLNSAGYGWETDTIAASDYHRMIGFDCSDMNTREYVHAIEQRVASGAINMDTIGWRAMHSGQFTGDVHSVGGGIERYNIVRKQVQRNADGSVALDADGKIVYLDTDGINGRSVINQKFDIIRNWLKQHFNYDIDKVHREVQRRQYVMNDDGTYKLDANGDPINALIQPSSSDPSKTVMQALVDQVEQLKNIQ